MFSSKFINISKMVCKLVLPISTMYEDFENSEQLMEITLLTTIKKIFR